MKIDGLKVNFSSAESGASAMILRGVFGPSSQARVCVIVRGVFIRNPPQKLARGHSMLGKCWSRIFSDPDDDTQPEQEETL